MSNVDPQQLAKLTAITEASWRHAGVALFETTGKMYEISPVETEAIETNELFSQLAAPVLSAQFSVALHPDNHQILYLSDEHAMLLAADVTGAEVTAFSEHLADILGPTLNSLISGISQELTGATGEDYTGYEVVVKAQTFAFPPNFLQIDEIIRSSAEVQVGDETIKLFWMLDLETLERLASEPQQGMGINPEADLPFNQLLDINESLMAPMAGGMAGLATAPAPVMVAQEQTGLELLLDIPLEVTVELGRVKMLIRDVVDLGAGSIIELDKTAGEPVDVMVNGRLVARGEVVVIEDNFGVRITEILSPAERLKRLGDIDL